MMTPGEVYVDMIDTPRGFTGSDIIKYLSKILIKRVE